MLPILGVLGNQEIVLLLLLFIILISIPITAYYAGKKRGRIEGKLEAMEQQQKKRE